MRTCPDCGRGIEDDSLYCGYCDAKLPGVREGEKAGPAAEAGPETQAGGEVKAAEAPPAGGRCEKCGEQLDPNFYDTCWNCGAVKAGAPVPEPAEGEAAAAPLLTVFGRGKTLEISTDKVLIVYTGDPGAAGQGEVPRCEIGIKSIVSIELTNAKEGAEGCMLVNFTAAPPDDLRHVMNMSESVLFDAGVNQEMAKALELIKRRSAELDAQAGGN